jgi:beta-glucosidase
VYDTGESDWVFPGGEYQILVGASSRDIRLQASVQVHGTQAIQHPSDVPEWYSHPVGTVTQDDFEALLGRKIEPVKPRQKGEYTVECTFEDMEDNFIIHQVVKGIEKSIAKSFGGADYTNPTFKMIMTSVMTTPLKNLNQMSPNSMPRNMTEGLVHLANGKILQGIITLAKRTKAQKTNT